MSGNKSQDAAAKSVESGFSENELDDIMAEFASLDEELTSKMPAEEAVAEVETIEEVEENPLDAALSATVETPEEPVVAETIVEEPVAKEVPEQIVAQADIEEVETESLEQKLAEGFDTDEMDAIMKDLEEIDASSPAAELEFDEELAPVEVKNEDNENVLVINQPTKVATAPTPESGEVAFSAAGNMNFNVNLTIAGSQATLSVEDGHFTLSMNGVDISITEEGCKAVIEGGVNFNIPLPTATSKKNAA